MKVDGIEAKGLLLQLMKAKGLAESSYFIYFHEDLSAPATSTDMSQVDVTLFPSFKNIFLLFYLSRFFFYIKLCYILLQYIQLIFTVLFSYEFINIFYYWITKSQKTPKRRNLGISQERERREGVQV